MKVSKEFKIGLIVILSTALLIYGVNYLKGNSFFGGDDVYHCFFPTSGSLTPSSAVTLNGVKVGRVMNVKLVSPNKFSDPNKRVLVTFSIQSKELRVAKGSGFTIIPGVLSTELQIKQNFIADKGFFKVGDTLSGSVSQEITEQIESQLLPVKRKLEDLMTSIDNIVTSISVFWDTSAAYTLDQGLNEVKIAISRFGNVAYNLNELIKGQRGKLDHIFTNVEDITSEFKQTNQDIQVAAANIRSISDSLVSVDFKNTISEATETIEKLNVVLAKVADGEGTLGKLMNDEQLYNELNNTNEKLQALVEDIKLHPERYIHFSVFGRKSKGVPLTKDEEEKLKQFLDTLTNEN